MSPLILRLSTTLFAFLAAGGFGWGVGVVARQAQQLSATFGGGFVLILVMMTLLVLISLARLPLSHAASRRRSR
jgi:hypothetical protein